MNQDMLVTIEDESLDAVAGGARLPIKAVTTALLGGLFGAGKALVDAGVSVIGSVTKFVDDVIHETTDL